MGKSEVILGKLITDDIANVPRDAIHIAIAPVIAGCNLSPGEWIGITQKNHNGNNVVGAFGVEFIGIVDPFLEYDISIGDVFYMFLFPNTITSLRHDWTHPDFDKVDKVDKEKKSEKYKHFPVKDEWKESTESELYLQNFADEADLTYNELILAAQAYLKYGHYLIDGGKWDGMHVPDEFWDHFENVTQTKVPEDDRGTFFSCSC